LKIFLFLLSISDSFLLVYAQKLIHNNGSKIILLDATGVIRQTPELKESIRSIEQVARTTSLFTRTEKLKKISWTSRT